MAKPRLAQLKEGKKWFYTDGQFFGEVALLKEQTRNATITATEPATVYRLSKENSLAFVQSHKSFEEQTLGTILARG